MNKWWRSLRYELRSRRTVSMVMLHSMAFLMPLLYLTSGSAEQPLTAWSFASMFTNPLALVGAPLVAMISAVSVGSEFRFGTAGQTVNWMEVGPASL